MYRILHIPSGKYLHVAKGYISPGPFSDIYTINPEETMKSIEMATFYSAPKFVEASFKLLLLLKFIEIWLENENIKTNFTFKEFAIIKCK